LANLFINVAFTFSIFDTIFSFFFYDSPVFSGLFITDEWLIRIGVNAICLYAAFFKAVSIKLYLCSDALFAISIFFLWVNYGNKPTFGSMAILVNSNEWEGSGIIERGRPVGAHNKVRS
jgi:hypothetical protein